VRLFPPPSASAGFAAVASVLLAPVTVSTGRLLAS
jgi:hypothetical protein